MTEDPRPCGDYPVGFCKFAIGFIALSTYLVMHQIDIISRHIAVAFNIPTNNTGIYLEKLYCLRTLGFVIGGFIENGIFQSFGGDADLATSVPSRRKVSVGGLSMVLIARCVYLFFLFTSSQLSYHIYIVLVFEAVTTGFHDTAFMALGSEFMTVISPMYNVCRIFISCCQFVLDRFWFDKPLRMVRIQVSICVTFTAISVFLWYNYNINIKGDHLKKHIDDKKKTENEHKDVEVSMELSEPEPKEEECHEYCKQCKKNIGNDGVGAALSPALMYCATTTFNDFMFPSVLPYGLLERDKCHIINIMNPFFIFVGPASLFILDNFTPYFACWSWHYHLFWILFIPLPIIFTYAMKAIFTPNPSARRIINSQKRVACMTLAAMFSFGCNEPLSYIGLAKYAFRLNPGGFTLLGYHITAALFCRYLSSKIAVGLTDTRISLGYHLPKFRPNHRMSKRNLGWYIFRQTFVRTWKRCQRRPQIRYQKISVTLQIMLIS